MTVLTGAFPDNNYFWQELLLHSFKEIVETSSSKNVWKATGAKMSGNLFFFSDVCMCHGPVIAGVNWVDGILQTYTQSVNKHMA